MVWIIGGPLLASVALLLIGNLDSSLRFTTSFSMLPASMMMRPGRAAASMLARRSAVGGGAGGTPMIRNIAGISAAAGSASMIADGPSIVARHGNRLTLRGGSTQGTWGRWRGGGDGGGGVVFSMVATQEASLSSMRADMKKGPMPSAVNPKYHIVSEEYVSEYGATTTLYRHKKSGAEILSVQTDDDNKVFGVTFRTPPEDSTGVPHILEHSVLCGSKKYPVKEPFVDLLKGSLQTFLNAFTYPDRTCYPVASQNTQDFYNLMGVYLDAVFFPRAVVDPQVIQQEGWHYELEEPSQPLTYKGVVFNEMKGVYSSPDSRHGRACQQALFPDNTYGVDSGGDPRVIPNLTFDYFKGFHSKFYHPANSRIFFYGDDDPGKRLELLDEYLAQFDDTVDTKTTAVSWQMKRKQPWKIQEKFPAGEDAKNKHMVSVNWLLNEQPLTVRDSLVLNVVDDLLVGNSAAVLTKVLTESGYGESVIGGGLSDELQQATYSIGLKGVKPEDVPKVEQLIYDTLDKVLKDGFEQDAIEASINSIEFTLREFNTGSFPRGLSFMLGAMSKWVYNGSPTEGLRFEEPLRQMKEELAAGKPIFTDMVRELLVGNTHRCTVEMIPDTGLEKQLEEEEKSKLSAVKGKMTEEQINEIIESTKRLKEAQAAEDSPEAKATLPSLDVKDLDRKSKEIPIVESEVQGVKVLTHPIQTSGILYADVGIDTTCLDIEDYTVLGIFARMLLETGTSKMDRVAMTRKIGARTGGIFTSSLSGQPYNGGKVAKPDELISYLFLRGKAVTANAEDLFSLMYQVLTDANLDSQQRVVEMLKESKASMDAGIVGSGHSYAAKRIDARYTLDGYLGEIAGGISHLNTLKQNLETAEKDWPTMLAKLERVRATLLSKKNFIINLTGDEEVLKTAQPAVENFVSGLPEETAGGVVKNSKWSEVYKPLEAKNEGFVVPTQVNYVGLGGRMYEPGEKVPASTNVVSRALRTGFLWDNVRVMGGAYGAFCRFNAMTGIFSFLSYRDPNLDKTLTTYNSCGSFLQDFHVSQEELDMNIIGTIGDIDSPMQPDQKGFTSLRRYLLGQTAEDRQEFRDGILSTTAKDFKDFGDRLLAMKKDVKCAVVGSKAAFEAANAALPAEEQIETQDVF